MEGKNTRAFISLRIMGAASGKGVFGGDRGHGDAGGLQRLAQTSPLVGAWSHSDYGANGKAWLVTYLVFSANGQVGLKAFHTGGPSTPFVETGQYTIKGSGVEMVFRDFSPKQCVSIAGRVGCEPPPIPLNQPVSRGVSLQGANSIRFSDGAVYARAPAVP